jgi:RNA polymerase sigma-70 factor (ECF subfamily)
VWSQLSDDLRRFIRRRVADDHVADDLLQETSLRIHRSIDSLAEADRLAAWVYRIAHNVIHDHYRKTPCTTLALADNDPVAEDKNRMSQRRCRAGAWLEEMVRQLPNKYREAVQLSEIEGLSQQEVTDRLGLSLSGAKLRIQRGRSILKATLDQCCTFEYDRRGNVMDYDPKPDRTMCRDCDE